GGMMIAMWESDSPPPAAGGQVVRDILEEAINRAGYRARVQGPSMAHVDVRLIFDETASSLSEEHSGWRQWDIRFPGAAPDSDAALKQLFRATLFQVCAYYIATNANETFMHIKSHLDGGIQLL